MNTICIAQSQVEKKISLLDAKKFLSAKQLNKKAFERENKS